MQTVTIGRVRIEKPTRFRNNSEFARWYDEIEVAPCEVDLVADVDGKGEVKDTSVRYKVSGPVVSSDWSPCFGGVPFGNGVDKDLGETRDHYAYSYAHALAKAILDGKASHVTLMGFAAVPIDFEWNGEPCRTYAIKRLEA